MPTTQDLMNLIGRMEGWGIANSVSTRNNNPGNLRYVGQSGALGPDSKGYAIFTSPEAGMSALQRQIELDASRDLSIREFVNKYAPSSENNTSNYLAFIVNGLGVEPDSPLINVTGEDVKKNFLGSGDGGFVSGFDDVEGINLGIFDMSFNSNSDGIPWGAILLGAVAVGVIWKLG